MSCCWSVWAADDGLERAFSEQEREHWSFQRINKPALPEVRDTGWGQKPIDRFILARLEGEGLRPSAAAGRRTLLRRVYLDVIGLPPTIAEQQDFLDDTSPDAYEKLVDDLLSRPQFGERWARHWLDAVRYAESNGYERDGPKPNVWRYRDYVIRSINDDLPYDRFLTEQLAGDELEGSDARTQVATTFLRLGTWDDEPAEAKLDRYEQLDDVLGTTSLAFMGLTLQCARCHAHKFEPLTQVDYARLLAVFEPLKRPQDGRADLDRFVGSKEELAAYRSKLRTVEERRRAAEAAMETVVRRVRSSLFQEKKTRLPADAVAAFECEPSKRTPAQKQLVSKYEKLLHDEMIAIASAEDKQSMQQWKDEIVKAKAARPSDPPRGYVWYEDGKDIPLTHVFFRGDPERPLKKVDPGAPGILASPEQPPTPLPDSSGRRLWLARWLTNPSHPLTARVFVNRLWSWHMGEGIVSTENDFGVMGDSPSHPELLDWLAATLMEHGWKPKAIHRMILLSNAYRQSSAWDDKAGKKDPGNRLLWRWKPRRLEGEVVRDMSLAVSGKLNLAMFGPSVFPDIPRAVLDGQSRPGEGWGRSSPNEANRRSIYVFVKRSVRVPELDVLDFPDTTQSCEQRIVSTVAPQALTLMNGAFFQSQADALARRIYKEAKPSDADRVRHAFSLALSLEPTPAQLARCEKFLADESRRTAAKDPGATEEKKSIEALTAFALVLLNSNQFVYLD